MADDVLFGPVFLDVIAFLFFSRPSDASVTHLTTLCQHVQASLRARRARFTAELARSRRRYRRRRRAFLLSSLAALVSLGTTTRKSTWIRRQPTSNGREFWSIVKRFDDDQWRAHFRMSRATFDYLLGLISPSLSKQTMRWRAPIEPRRRLAVVLWWFATPGEYRTVACLFGVGVSTVCTLVRQVTRALLTLRRRFISLPRGQRLDETIRGFQLERDYPQCAGAIAGTHIPINPWSSPRDRPSTDYLNRTGWHSIILQVVVDHKLCFTDVYVGWPGSAHDTTVLESSDIFLNAERHQGGYLFPREKSKIVDGVEIPVHIIGDAAYPLKQWLMPGFSEHHQLSADQSFFTHTLSSARMVVENAIGRLKGRWHCLLKRTALQPRFMPDIVTACCILHNVCEIQKEHFLPEWKVADNNPTQPNAVPYEGEGLNGAQMIRDTITANLSSMLL